MPVGPLRLLECATDSFLDTGPGVAAVEPAPVVVERRPGKVRELQQEGERVVRLKIVDSLNFQRRSGDLKARNFPK